MNRITRFFEELYEDFHRMRPGEQVAAIYTAAERLRAEAARK